MTLPHVAVGDPHAPAHNAERDKINTLQGNLNSHISQATDAHDASAISVVATALVLSTDVQAALQEVGGKVRDSGWRSLPLANGWTGTLILRRIGQSCDLRGIGLNGSAATNSNIANNLGNLASAGANTPAYGTGVKGSSQVTGTIGHVALNGGNDNQILRADGTAAWTGGYFQMSFFTNLAWPGTLPGVAYP